MEGNRIRVELTEKSKEINEKANEINEAEGKEVYFKGFPSNADEESVLNFFEKFGKIEKIKYFEKSNDGHGYIQFSSKDDCEKLLNEPDDIIFDGNKILVKLSMKGRGNKKEEKIENNQESKIIRVKNRRVEGKKRRKS